VLACGAKTNTFNIPGVAEHALFLKDIADARKIRGRVIARFELASQPGTSPERQRDLLHFAVVGAGPTGIEFAAELNDFVSQDMAELYPDLVKQATMTVYDVSRKILSNFDENLGDYAMNRFKRKGIQLALGVNVKEVLHDQLVFEDGSKTVFGLLVWSTGLAPVDLVRDLQSVAKNPNHKVMVDPYLRVLDTTGAPIDGVFALGDCATLVDSPLPATAQVANQQAIYLAKLFNASAKSPDGDFTKLAKPFSFADMGSMAYIGDWKAIVDLKGKNDSRGQLSGAAAWLFWRSAYFTMSVSTKNKILIPMYWFLTWIFGRDIARIS
jgi:NADH dehydrogenase FAD-containing subunit